MVAAFILLAALGLQLGGIVLAQAEPQLTSQYTSEALPLTDPQASFWERVPVAALPLTAQAGVPPTLPERSVPAVRVRSANNGEWLSFLVEWDDATNNAFATKPDEFRDAVALQFPVDAGTPGVCMGMRGKPVNLWHWKADWQSDIDNGFRDVVDAYPNFWKDYYPFAIGTPPYRMPTSFAGDASAYLAGWAAGNPLSDPARVTPVEELAAMGFGTATHRVQQSVIGRGVWQDGRWRVVVSRRLTNVDLSSVRLSSSRQAFVAFAVWNGSNSEVGGRKQISSDMAFIIEEAPREATAPRPTPTPGPGMPWWALLLISLGGAAIVSLGMVFLYLLRMARRTGGA